MIAIVSKNEENLSDDQAIVVRVGESTCAIRRSHIIPKGWNRIPMHIAMSLVSRQNAQWVNPSTGTEGMRLIADMEKEWLAYLSSNKESGPPSRGFPPVTSGSKKRKSLIDVQEARERKARYFNG